MLQFVQRMISESKLRQLYKRLDQLYNQAIVTLKQQQEEGITAKDLHPKVEQSWFIDYFKLKMDEFSSQEVWLLIMNHEHRDKYMKYLSYISDVNAFEIFLQNYFIPAIEGSLLKELFFIAFDGLELDRKSQLEKLLECLHCKQGKCLLEAIKQDVVSSSLWEKYCHDVISCMRNAQIKISIPIIPTELEAYALEKLYPCEVLEVVDQELDESKKKILIKKALEGCQKWWSSFSQDEINLTKSLLISK